MDVSARGRKLLAAKLKTQNSAGDNAQ